MPEFAYGLTQRDLIQDAAVVEELDRLVARLNGFLRGIGQVNEEEEAGKGNLPGNTVIMQSVQQEGASIFPVKDIELSSDINEIDPEDFTVLRVRPVGAARNVHGMKGGSDGREVRLYTPADAAFALTLLNNSSSAQADRRFANTGAADLATVASEPRGFIYVYDAASKLWVQLGGSAAIAAAGATIITQDFVTYQSVVVNGTETLVSISIPSNTLTTDGDMVKFVLHGDWVDAARNKIWLVTVATAAVHPPGTSFSEQYRHEFVAFGEILRISSTQMIASVTSGMFTDTGQTTRVLLHGAVTITSDPAASFTIDLGVTTSASAVTGELTYRGIIVYKTRGG